MAETKAAPFSSAKVTDFFRRRGGDVLWELSASAGLIGAECTLAGFSVTDGAGEESGAVTGVEDGGDRDA